ncbi:ABC transporter substrate-binding protein [Candidatus Albibeggiatoa sp. nov. NOAA]|uniref:ABC transporter substrate-binding protein n=1 Tax=Candidatus Albibeggiatoa sp. nov. NOAA TaxID=3162724 RepID=UPI0032F3C00A|nr:ABC transporter substrate-binding protein [Thiotrichaceae bacterium]
MNHDLYNIIVTGVLDGHTHEAVQLKLAETLGIEPQDVSKLFLKPTIVKHACSQQMADDYQNRLQTLGIQCHIEPVTKEHSKQELDELATQCRTVLEKVEHALDNELGQKPVQELHFTDIQEKPPKKRMSTMSMLTLLLLPVFLLAAFLWQNGSFTKPQPLYVALAAPLQTGNGQAMLKGVQLYLDTYNKQHPEKPIELLTFDDESNADKARQVAQQIVDNPDISAVIGHYTSTASLAASEIYEQAGIPAVSATALANELTRNNDWYFRVIFNNGDQGALLANYVKKTLNFETAYVITDTGAYGSGLAESFINTANSIGLPINQHWRCSNSDQEGLKEMIAEMQETIPDDESSVLFVGTYGTDAVEILTSMKSKNRKMTIIGSEAFSTKGFQDQLARYPQERTSPGYYSDGTYAAMPFLVDISNQRAQIFSRDYFNAFGEKASATSALTYDAALLLAHVMKDLDVSLPSKEKRLAVRDNLYNMTMPDRAIEGVTGYLYFDAYGDAVKPISVAMYQKGIPVAALYQYQPLNNLGQVDNLLKEVLEERIISLNGKFMHRAQVVYTGMDFNELTELDTSKSAFVADFFLWFRFKDEFDDKNVNLVNAVDSTTKYFTDPLFVSTNEETGVTTHTYRIKTSFKGHFNFKRYPLDIQRLPIKLRHQTLTRDKLIYVVDTLGMGVDGKLGTLAMQDKFERNNVFTIGGWQVRNIAFYQNSRKSDSTLGMPELFGSQQRIEYSQFNAYVEVERHVLSFILKNLLSVIFVVALGYLAFYITDFYTGLFLNINMIISTSLFHLNLSSQLNNISYVVLIEYVFYMVYMLAIFAIMIQVIMYVHADDDRFEQNLRTFGKVSYPIFIVLTLGLAFWLH